MLEITTIEDEFYDSRTNKFIHIPACTLTLEHSLISVAKWEAKWQIPFFDSKPKTPEQDLDYIRCMVIGNIKDDRVFEALSVENIIQIQNYMSAPMTATVIKETPNKNTKKRKEVMTAEVIYAHMFTLNIPLECQKWHINRLFTLLKVCNLQSAPKEKMTPAQTRAWNAEQNAARRAKYNSRG